MKKVIAVVAVAVVAVAGFLGLRELRRARAEAATNWQTAQVHRGALTATINAAGAVQAASQVSLAFQTGGQLTEIRVSEGEQVQAGQVIAVLDTSDLELAVAQSEAALTIQQAKLEQTKGAANPNDLAAAEAGLASAQAAYDAAKAKAGLNDAQLTVARAALDKATMALQDAQAAYDRVAWQPGIAAMPQSKALQQATIDYESAKANYDLQVAAINDTAVKSAYAQLVQAEAQLAKLKGGLSTQEAIIADAQVKQAHISLQQARNKLQAASLTAPFAGTVTRLALQVGQMVAAGTAVGSLADLGTLEIAVDMSEIDVARVQVGQEVDITLDALPGSAFKGHVSKVAASGTSTQGVVNYPVVIRFDEAGAAIKPGMTANASIVIERRDNVLLVPTRAVRTQGGQRVVQVLRERQVVDVPVQV
ncbi:MAG TPA: efflux RND transporter periplasmic adaptor subunit, partial [Anaerolineae bacterium]|nr:efflux RND transporter periplasmic adaptor subunit [Anaerolineae bacterium]